MFWSITGTQKSNRVHACSHALWFPLYREQGSPRGPQADLLYPTFEGSLKAGVHNHSLNISSVWSGTSYNRGNEWGFDLSLALHENGCTWKTWRLTAANGYTCTDKICPRAALIFILLAICFLLSPCKPLNLNIFEFCSLRQNTLYLFVRGDFLFYFFTLCIPLGMGNNQKVFVSFNKDGIKD